jgi:hypothetical protein
LKEKRFEMTTSKELYTKILPHAMAAYTAKSADMQSAKQMAHSLAVECVTECGRLGMLEDVMPVQRQYVAAPLGSTNLAIGGGGGGGGSQGLATFAESQLQGGPVSGVNPVGAPYQPAPHYNMANRPGGGVQPSAPQPAPAPPWYPPHLAHLHQPPISAAPVGTPQALVASGEGQVVSQMQPYDVAGLKMVPPTGNTFVPPAQAGVMNNVVQVPTPQGHSALGTDGVIAQPSQRPNTQDAIIAPASQLVVQQAGGAGTTFVPERIVR